MESSGGGPQLDPSKAPNELLAPGAALAQFEPPEGMHIAAAEPAQQKERVRYGFRIGGLRLLISKNAGSELLAMPQVTPLPRAPAGFLGLINLRGNLVPIYDLRVLLQLEPHTSGAVPLAVVFDQGDKAVGVAVDDYPVALPALRPLSGAPPVPDVLRDHARGGYLQEDEIWLEFDHGSFFDEVSRGITLETI
jgi:twitching motility protein PilI